MVIAISPILADKSEELQVEQLEKKQKFLSLEEFIAHPPERMEWVDGQLVEKTGIGFKHCWRESLAKKPIL